MLPDRINFQPTKSVVIECYFKKKEESSYMETFSKKSRKSDLMEEKTTPSVKKSFVSPQIQPKSPCLPLAVLIEEEWPAEPNYLAALHPHPNDWRVHFNPENHSYFINYSSENKYPAEFNLSASTWAKQQFPEFNADIAIRRIQHSFDWKRGKSKYCGMTADQIKKSWDDNSSRASRQGSFYHLLFERHCNGQDISKYEHLLPVQQYLKWRKNFFDVDFLPFRTEIRLYSDVDEMIVGTSDLFAIRKNHGSPEETGGVLTLSIFDWKNTKDLKMDNTRNEYGRGACSRLLNCNSSHYFLQQHIYRWLALTYYQEGWVWNGQKYTSLKIEFMKLIIVHDLLQSSEAMMIDVPDMSDIIKQLVVERRAHLSQMKCEYDSQRLVAIADTGG